VFKLLLLIALKVQTTNWVL